MKILAVVLLLFTSIASAAGFPPESEHISDCEDRWFLKETDDSAVRILGFAYVDPTAGVTIEHHGEVAINSDGHLFRKSIGLEKARLIIRVTSNVPVACLGNDQVQRLGLKPVSEFLRFYKDERAIGPHNVSWASHYNQIGAPETALRFIHIAENAAYESPQMSLEQCYAYNAMGRFEEAIGVLKLAIAKSPDNRLLLAELAFSYGNSQEFKKAIDLYESLLSKDTSGESGLRAGYAHNLAAAYRAIGSLDPAEKWEQQAAAWQKSDQSK